MRLFILVVVAAATVVVPAYCADGARPDGPPAAALPVGKWTVEFANGVKEAYDIGNGGECVVTEPQRNSVGMAVVQGGAVVITTGGAGGERVERWTPVGKRYVVEHWFPANQVPVVSPVLGIAERAP